MATKSTAASATSGAESTTTKSDHTHVKYTGHSTVRVISAGDWSSVGADEQKMTRWEQKNDWALPVDDFSAAALRYVERDPNLKLVTISE